MNKEIQIRNNNYKLVKWEQLKAFDANTLKETETRDVSKLKNAIVNSKFSFPFYVWKRYIVDGAGRVKALKELEAEGYVVPELPIIEIDAENEREAKKLVLQASSQHGEITKEALNDFVFDLDLSKLELEELNIGLDDIENSSLDMNWQANEEDDELTDDNKQAQTPSSPDDLGKLEIVTSFEKKKIILANLSKIKSEHYYETLADSLIHLIDFYAGNNH